MFRSGGMRASGRVSSLCRYRHWWQRGDVTTEATKAADHQFHTHRQIADGCEPIAEIRAVLAVQHCHRRYVPVGGAGRYGVALHILLSRRQSQKVAHGEKAPDAGESAGCPAEAQKASSRIEHAASTVELCT